MRRSPLLTPQKPRKKRRQSKIIIRDSWRIAGPPACDFSFPWSFQLEGKGFRSLAKCGKAGYLSGRILPNELISMKRFLFLIASSILFFASLATSWADSFVMEAGNGKKLYKWDGKHLMTYTNGRKLFKWDGQHIMLYSNGKKLYRWDGVHLMAYGNGKKLYKWDGKHMMTYGNGKKLFTWEGQYVKVYGNGKKLLKTEGVIPIPFVIALVTGQI